MQKSKLKSRKIIDENFIKNKLAPEFLFGLIIAIIGGYIGGILTYQHVNRLEEFRLEQAESTRRILHGFWVFRIKIENSDLSQYAGIEIFNLSSLTIDKNFQVSGVAYKWKEKNEAGEFIYPRKVRSKATINGSIINKKIILNLTNSTKDGLESIGILDGELVKEDTLKGSFLSDVAFQRGSFCARKIRIKELQNKDLDCDL